MAFIRTKNVKIAGISASIPRNQVSNNDLLGISEESIELLPNRYLHPRLHKLVEFIFGRKCSKWFLETIGFIVW